MSNNIAGNNGHQEDNRPDDAVLEAILREYVCRGLKADEKLIYLRRDRNFIISKETLARFHRQFDISTPRRRPTSTAVAMLAIGELLAEDGHSRRGPKAVQEILRTRDGVVVSRNVVRDIMETLVPGGSAKRRPPNFTRINSNGDLETMDRSVRGVVIRKLGESL
ncbi:hypothetical protein BDV98DRAFT_401503 [Pterulicium gracile]|uniref:Uncharacterized protein n=1 Tax=Pterulicium gracile TaxID=1884261 RepID=A0A5C3Q0Q2_9AGAR|nr:hypothetical protein BDV98DRAFT_401503 [Pterula gracilis]